MGLIDGYGNKIGVDTSSFEPSLKDIPKVFLDGTLPSTKNDGEYLLKFRYFSNSAEYSGYCTAKVQGDSSTRWPKKNFTLKLFKDSEKSKKLKIDFKGWGEQSKFVIKANWIDILHVRNIGCARLWGDVVKSRVGYDDIPELLRTSPNQGAVDGFPVKVYNNGIYLGRYDFNIPKDKWMTNMDDGNSNHCIMGSEAYSNYCAFKETPLCNGTDWTDELHDVMPTNIKNSFIAMATFVNESSDTDFVNNVGTYLDVESIIDAYCFLSACCLWDSNQKNQMFLTYDGVQWYQTMYDMDCAFGMFWTGTWIENSYIQNGVRMDAGNRLLYKVGRLLTTDVQSRYAELRNSVLSAGHIISRLEQWTDITPPELLAEDYATTTANGTFTEIPLKTENTVPKLREWVNTILASSDDWVDGLSTLEGGE